MDAVLVVVAQVGLQVAFEGAQLGHEGAGEGTPPALLEDGPLDALDGTVGLRSAGMDEAVLGGECGSGRPEGLGAELGAVVGSDAFEGPAASGEVRRRFPEELAGEACIGVVRCVVEVCPA